VNGISIFGFLVDELGAACLEFTTSSSGHSHYCELLDFQICTASLAKQFIVPSQLLTQAYPWLLLLALLMMKNPCNFKCYLSKTKRPYKEDHCCWSM